MDNTTKVFMGFTVGALAGLVTGALVAPHSGKKTRKMIVDEAEKMKDSFAHKVDDTIDLAKSKYNSMIDEYIKLAKGDKKEVDQKEAAIHN